jgi:hypothetical protein
VAALDRREALWATSSRPRPELRTELAGDELDLALVDAYLAGYAQAIAEARELLDGGVRARRRRSPRRWAISRELLLRACGLE